ncbi:Male sterility, NAD-binding [Penicillium occitanis (nom. inval.)]|nr:Male sterility, NAD-binding [Penicillium occitanis (nom. inval.)]PCH00632.1 hypothetical protein PENOC_052190 [Penicillium occitanis (nom. inval.)]
MAIVYSEEFKHIANDLQKLEPDLFTVELPSLETLLSVETSSSPYRKAFAEAEEVPVLHIHSSGSTELIQMLRQPEIITMANGSRAVTDNDRNMPTPPGRKAQNGSQFDFENGGRFYTCFPPYHKLPAYARIARSKILVNIPEKPFHRTAKETVSRKSTIAEYSMEIAALYSKDTSGDGVMLPEISLDGRNFDNIIRFLRLTFISVLGIDVTDDHASLFDIGMDSVKVFEALSMLKKARMFFDNWSSFQTYRRFTASSDQDLFGGTMISLTMMNMRGKSSDSRQLLLDVNVIICLAWKVDFNGSLQAFEADCIHSIRAFIGFNLQSRLNPRIVFASSTIYALSHTCIQGASTVPEDIISPPSIDTGTWYGQSKEVAERILAYSAKHSGVPVSILRLGQNSSAEEESSTSSWLNQEWIPSLVHTSKTLKVVPNLKTPINWVPVDRMANIILDLTFVGKDPSKSSDDENRARQASVYNIVHPRPIPWSRFAQVLSQMLPGCKIVTLRQWIEIVKIHSESSQHKHKEALKTIPAVKLISFFEYMSMHEDSLGSRSVGIITDKAISQSTTLSSIPEIGDDSLEKWARV